MSDETEIADGALVPAQAQNLVAVEPAMSIEAAAEQLQKLQRFVSSQLKEGVHYGTIPGAKKPSLWKPGAEAILNFHGLTCIPEKAEETVIDFEKGFFHYSYKAIVYNRRGQIAAQAEGSCNSKESKYRYLWVYENAIPKGYVKSDLIEKNGKYRIDNDDPYSLVNTIQKMAQKRAVVAATLLACRASAIFDHSVDEDGTPVPEGAVRSAPRHTSGGGARTITEKQQKFLFALVKKKKATMDEFKSWLVDKFPYTAGDDGEAHTARIRMSDMDAIVKSLGGS